MKIILMLAITSILFASCAEPALPDKISDVTKNSAISESTAKKMIRHFKDCSGECNTTENIWTRNDTLNIILTDLKREYGVAGYVLLDARYRKEDEKRYKKLNRISEQAQETHSRKEGDVADYTTKILMVTTSDGDYKYFDVVSICPPPNGCNGESTGSAQRTIKKNPTNSGQ